MVRAIALKKICISTTVMGEGFQTSCTVSYSGKKLLVHGRLLMLPVLFMCLAKALFALKHCACLKSLKVVATLPYFTARSNHMTTDMS